jgi:UDP-N-acetylmuramoyl-tripeptide--D-alanyl-D-alanine ligase
MFTLTDVLVATGGQRIAGGDQATFASVANDSRSVSSGDLFVAFRGQTHDGHQYVAQALRAGAAGALVEYVPPGLETSAGSAGPPIVLCRSTYDALEDLARYWRRRHGTPIVGVTGSVGKTTTKELIAGVLSARFSVLRSQANYNTEIGLPMTLMQLDAHHGVGVLEMGMYQIGDIRRLARIAEPQVGIVTVVHPNHLERLGTIERIALAKRELIEELPASGLALLNADDERVRAMAEFSPWARRH